MKAKEYFQKYISENQDKSRDWRVYKFFRDVFLEAAELRDTRKAHTSTALRAIFNELNIKANAVIKMINAHENPEEVGSIKSDAFKLWVEAESETLYSAVFPKQSHQTNCHHESIRTY